MNEVKAVFRKVHRAQNPDDYESWTEDEQTNTLTLFDVGDVRATQIVVTEEGRPRRLTPQDWEVCFGFPPGYTDVPKGKAPENPRYRALGNSWAVPCVAWIGRRIADLETETEN